MSTFFASDIHFGHQNLIRYCPNSRGQFTTAPEVDEHVITEWNKKIYRSDLVYILGDLGHGSSTKNVSECISRLNGRKVLITGNHDKKMWRQVEHHFYEVHQAYHEAWVEGKFVTMCHYPIWEWNAIHRGSYHVHGHLHGKPHGIPGRILDVGIDNHNLRPWSFDEIVQHMEKQPIRGHY